MTRSGAYEEFAIDIGSLRVKAHEKYSLNASTVLSYFVNGDSGRALFWKTVNAGADCRKSNASDLELVRHFERLAIAASQQAVFFVIPAAPYGANGVNHVLCRQIVAFGRLGFAGFATAQQTTLGNQSRPGRTVNGAIHSASTQQRTVGCVNDRVKCLPGYVSLKNLDSEAHVVSVFPKGKVFLYPRTPRTRRSRIRQVYMN
jgi:hypothetical protein